MTINERVESLIDSLTFLCEDLEASPEQFDSEQTELLTALDNAVDTLLNEEG